MSRVADIMFKVDKDFKEMIVYVIISEYPQEGGARIEGVYKDLKMAEHIFDLLEKNNSGRKFLMEEQEIR